MAKTQKLFTEQSSTINKQLTDQKDLLKHRFAEADTALEKRFGESNSAVEQRIIDSELRLGTRLAAIKVTAGQFKSWHHDTDGTMDDLRLEVGKLANQ